MSKRLVALIMLLALTGSTAACGVKSKGTATKASSSSAPAAGKAQSAMANPTEALAPAPVSRDLATADSGGAAGITPPVVDLPPLPDAGVPGSTKVIKNVSLEIKIGKGQFQRQFARASTLAEQYQGYVSASQVSGGQDDQNGKLSSGTLTIRVPSDRFEQVVARLKALGTVTGEDRSSQDVSKQFVDLEARLKQAQTEEAFFLKLMAEAKNVSDMIQVQSQLSGVQLQIEEIQGQLQYLKDQTSYSTISANIFEPGAATIGEPKPLAKAWQEAVKGFESVVSGAVVGLGWLAPFALLAMAGLGLYKLTRPRPKRPIEPEPSA